MDVCFFHESDFDGKMSAAIVKYFHPTVRLLGYNYNKSFPWDEINSMSHVIFVDIVPQPNDIMLQIYDRVTANGGSLTVIDHHKSWIESDAYQQLKDPCKDTFFCSIEKAACELTWLFFTRPVRWILNDSTWIPQLVSLLGQYDSWRLDKSPHDWDESVLPFQYGLRLADPSVSDLVAALKIAYQGYSGQDDMRRSETEWIMDTIATGNTVLKYQKSQNEIIMRNSSFDCEILGYKCLCVNANLFNSLTFESKWDSLHYDFMLGFSLGNDKRWHFSIYTDRDDRDASLLAKHFGGGGHKKASGFALNSDALVSLFKW